LSFTQIARYSLSAPILFALMLCRIDGMDLALDSDRKSLQTGPYRNEFIEIGMT
jgi:hypothetical protein